MANRTNDSTTKFKADISQLKTAMQDAARQVRLANSEFKAATAGMDDWSKSADGLSAKAEQLNKILKAQESQLESLEKQYELTAKEQGEDSKGAEELKIKINNQKAAIEQTKKEAGKYQTALDNLGNEMDDEQRETRELTDETKKAGDGFTVMKGALSDLVASGIKAAVQGLKNLAGAAKEAWQEFDAGGDIITKLTGATGEDAKAMEETYKSVAKSINADMTTIGNAIGEVNTRFGVTGDDLEELSKTFIKFADINDTDVKKSVDQVQKAMSAYGLGAEDAEGFLDRLSKTAQQTGVSTDSLENGIISNATAFQEMGLSIDQAVVLMGQLEKSGANSETVLNGMRKALKNSAKDGITINEALTNLQETIDKSKTSTEGLNAAYEVFGKSGDQIYGAIKNGSINFGELSKSADDASGTVANTFEQTQDAADRVKLALQGVKVDMASMVDEFLQKYEPQIKKALNSITDIISKLFKAFEKLAAYIEKHGPQIKTIISAIAGAFVALKVAGIIMALVSALTTLFGVIAAGTPVVTALMMAFNLNPISLLIGAIGALVAAFIYLWNTSEDFRNFFIGMWEAIKETVGEICAAIVQFFKDAWAGIKTVWGVVIKFFQDIWGGIKSAFDGATDWLSGIFTDAWDAVKKVWDGVKGFFEGIWKGIKDVFSGVGSWFEKVFQDARDAVETIFEGFVAIIKAPINLLIDGINLFIKGLNKIKIPSWVPGVGGKGLSFDTIAKLSEGGVLRKGQLGLLEGSGAEAVVPLEKNKEWIGRVVDEFKKQIDTSGLRIRANLNPSAMSGNGSGNQTTNMTFNQYNNSPKALDRMSIYRETNALLFSAKVRMRNV